MTEQAKPHRKDLATRIVRDLSPSEQVVLYDYTEDLVAIRSETTSTIDKAKKALGATAKPAVLAVLGETSARAVVDVAWKDRSWASRLGLGATALAMLAGGGQGAGIAALGSAIGVPLWVVFGAGGAFAGMLLDELAATGLKDHFSAARSLAEADPLSTDPKRIARDELDFDAVDHSELEAFDQELARSIGGQSDDDEGVEVAKGLLEAWNATLS